MLRDIAPVNASGVINIFKVTSGKREKILTRSNTILPNAAALLALVMSGDNSASLQVIEVYDGATLIYSASIGNKTYSAIGDRVTFQAIIPEAAFTGDIDNAKLGPSDPGTLGYFSTGTFATVTKAADEELIFEWDILFTNLPT